MTQSSLKALGKSEEDLKRDKRGAAWKKAVASRMREASSVKSAWLGERLNMGPGRNVNAMCGYYERTAKRSCEYALILEKAGER